MATGNAATAETGAALGLAVREVEEHVRNALNVVFDRAMANDPIAVLDDKDKSPAEGVLQDCEFGMILLMGRDWLARRDALDGSIADDEKVQDAVVALVHKALNRLTTRESADEGGESKDNKSVTFFSGEPYTLWGIGKNEENFCANLDAAMLTLAFLSSALARYNDALRREECGEVAIPRDAHPWVRSLRDAALFVCDEALEYAQNCRVVQEGEFCGFTSSPECIELGGQPGGIDDDSRLFFTWTACETASELLLWLPYLERLRNEPEDYAVPADVIERIVVRVNDLKEARARASQWCRDQFYERFATLERVDVAGLVREILPLGKKKLPPELEQRKQELWDYVQNVYHISQYAAIRSLVAGQVDLDEARMVLTRLHSLMTRDILQSGLDAADREQPALFPALTCNYELGEEKYGQYSDDAYCPLVVRSLSGLLTRTIDDLGRRETRSEVAKLAFEFRQVLADHYAALTERRPEIKNEGDDLLWSFARDAEYVFYATERTIFALITYAEFLEKVDEFAQAPVSPDAQAEQLCSLLADTFGKLLIGPAVRDFLGQLAEHASMTGSGPDRVPPLPLPPEKWAADTICNWLQELARDFRDSRIEQNLFRRANVLKNIRYIALEYKPTEGLHERQKKRIEQLRPKVQKHYEAIKAFEGFSGRLDGLQTWSPETLRPILFDYLFREFVRRPERSLGDQFEAEESDLVWSIIDQAEGELESIKEADPTAELP